MSENNTTNKFGLDTFVEVLKETEEKVRNTNKNENRSLRMIYGWDNPPLTQADLANKIKRLRRYVERHSFVVTENVKGIQKRLECQATKELTLKMNRPLKLQQFDDNF